MRTMKHIILFALFVITAGLVAACGSEEEAITLLDEDGEEVSIAGKDKPTVFFHFTGIN
ncbi:hypothetical protein [Bacillus piscicola]|uniref:hypothetical protein n=1 Tax=Bacillus piscicola TaxID=1632684 RepID=UPI001F097F2F|nr:hypothetical protein [Bacillus piscicola]